jgi:topoisomerase-4 subunit A
VFVGNDILYAQIFLKNDERTIYNIVYQDGKDGPLLAKRCAISGLTRDKEYNLTRGNFRVRKSYI